MPSFAWQELLSQWGREIIAEDELAEQLPPEVRASGWLGYPGATDEQISAAETRLGTTFPPSYREFLKVTNGWRMTTSFIERLWSTDEVAWMVDQDPDTVAIWEEYDDDVDDAEYLVYGTNVDQPLRGAYFRTALAVSDYGDGIYLLNPRTVTSEGEWEAWFFAPWIPGARRHRSFSDLMCAQHDSFLTQLKYDRGEPTPYVQPELGVDAEDLEGLIDVLKEGEQHRRMAALSALGNLRDTQAFEPVLAVFRNADEDLFVREHAARTLGMLRDPRAVQPLIEAFREPPGGAEGPKLGTLLGGMGDLPGGDMLRGMLNNASLDDLLGQMEAVLGKPMADHLRTTLTPEAVSNGLSDHFNNAVMQGLLELGEIALPAMMAALEDPEPRVRGAIARTLGARFRMNKDGSIRRALAVAQQHDPDPGVRQIAGQELGNMAAT